MSERGSILLIVFGILLSSQVFGQDKKEDKPVNVFAPLVERIDIGGQVRIRFEYKDAVDYRIPGSVIGERSITEEVSDGDEWILSRIRLHTNVKVKDDIDVFIQLQDSRTFGEEATVLTDLEGVDLHQGYIRFNNLLTKGISFQAGRIQFPNLGDGRIVNPLDWHNVARAFDGVIFEYKGDHYSVMSFAAVIDEDTSTKSADDYFSGIYSSTRHFEGLELDWYIFNRVQQDDVTSEVGSTGDWNDYTIGSRIKCDKLPVKCTLEGASQFGDYADDDIKAWALAAKAWYTFDYVCKPTVTMEYAMASGDENPSDGDRESFDPLYPFGHYYHGYVDVVRWQNIRTFMTSVSASPHEKWTVSADLHFFALDEKRDAWYSAAGSTIRRNTAGTADDDLGSELDLHARYKMTDTVDLWFGYSRFFAGEYVDDTGDDPDTDWVFFQLTVGF